MDLLGGFGDFEGQSSAPKANGTSAVSFPEQDEHALTELYAKDSGVLYETKDLQIGMKLAVENNHLAKLTFYYGNRLPNALTNVSASVSDTDQYKVKVAPTDPFEIAAKKQGQHQFQVYCLRPFKGPIPARVTFSYQGKSHSIIVNMPINVGRFITPVNLEGAAFMESWKKFGNEVQVTRKVDASDTKDEIESAVIDSMHLTLVEGVEKNPANFVGAGTFNTASKNAGGAYITMPVLIRVETKAAAYRLTVHSGHMTVSEAVVDAIQHATGSHE